MKLYIGIKKINVSQQNIVAKSGEMIHMSDMNACILYEKN